MNIARRLHPIDALAAHFRSSSSVPIGEQIALKVPSNLLGSLNESLGPSERPAGKTRACFTAVQIKNLLESISEEGFERWCLLDATTFTLVTKIFLRAAPCLANDKGLFRLIEALETLNDENNEFAMAREQLIDYKNQIGESLTIDLLDYFIIEGKSKISRRWVGLLLVELLGDSVANRKRIWKMPDKAFKDLGETILSGADRMLKIVAGKIIWQMVQDFEGEDEIRNRLHAFCNPGDVSSFANGFPLHNGTQWEKGFATFIADIEDDRYDLDIGLPSGYHGYQVKIGGNNLNSEIGAISINIAEVFSIYVPPNSDCSPDWVDFKIVNISKIEFTAQGIVGGDAVKDLAYFKLYLCDYEQDGYLYLLSMQPSSDSDNILILCDKADAEYFAEDVERYKSEVLKRKHDKSRMSSAPINDIQANPARHQSQQEKLEELERHRDDIWNVLESPAQSYVSSISVVDQGGNEDGLGIQMGFLDKPQGSIVVDSGAMREERRGEEEEEREEEGEQSTNSSGSENSDQNRTPSILAGQQTSVLPQPINGPAKNHTEISPREIGSSRKSYSTGDPPENVFEMAAKIHSDSEMTDITDAPDDQQLLLFRDPPTKLRASERLAESKAKLQKEFEVTDNKAAKRLEVVESKNKLRKQLKPVIPPELIVPQTLLARGTLAMKNQSGPKPTVTDSPQISCRPLRIKNSQENPETAYNEPQAKVAIHLDNPVKESIWTKDPGNPQYITSKTAQRLDDILIAQTPPLAVKISGTRPRPVLRSLTGLLEDVLTPPGTSEAKLIIQQNGTLKERLVGKGWESKEGTRSLQATKVKSNNISKVPKSVMGSERSKLISPEDTSIWDLPESEHSGNGGKHPTVKGKRKSMAGLKGQPPPPKVKQLVKSKSLSKKRAKSKKPQTNSEEKLDGQILDSEEEVELTEEDWPRFNAPPTVPIQKFGSKSVSGKRAAVVQESADEKSLPRTSELQMAQKLTTTLTQSKRIVIQNSSGEMNTAQNNKSSIPNWNKTQKQSSKLTPRSIPIRLPVTDNSNGRNIYSEKGQNLPSQPLRGRFQKVTSMLAQAKSITVQGDVDSTNWSEYTEKLPKENSEKTISVSTKSKSRPARATRKTQEILGSHISGILHNKSEADSPWRPKTRLQAKKELAAKSLGNNGAVMLGNRNPKVGVSLERESSGESQNEYKGINYPAPRSRPLGISDGLRTLPVEVNCSDMVKSLGSEIDVNAPTKVYGQAIERETMDKKFHLPGGALPGTLAQRSDRAENGPEDITIKLTHSGHEQSTVIISGSESGSEFEGTADLTGHVRMPHGTKIMPIAEELNANIQPIVGRPEAKGSDIGDRSKKDKSAGEHQAQNIPSAIVDGGPDKSPASAAVMDLGSTSANLPDSNTAHLVSVFSRENPKQVFPAVTPRPRRLDIPPKTPLSNLGILVDDHLARKAQIISWGGEGPRNQGRTPVVDQNPTISICQDEYLTNDDIPFKQKRDLSLYVLASGDEDRIVKRKKKSSPFTTRPIRGNTRTIVDRNGSPLLVMAHRGEIRPVESLKSDDSQEGGEGKDKFGSFVTDIIDNVVHADRGSYSGPKQEKKHSIIKKKPRGQSSGFTSHIDIWNAKNLGHDLTIEEVSDEELSISYPPEGAGENIKERKPIATKERAFGTRFEDRANREIGIIEILESDVERTARMAQTESLTTHQKYKQVPSIYRIPVLHVPGRVSNVNSVPTLERSLAPDKNSTAAQKRFSAFKRSLSAARGMVPVIDNIPANSDYQNTSFFNWLQGRGSNKVNNRSLNDELAPQDLSRSFQSTDPEKTLVDERLSDGAQTDQELTGNSEHRAGRGQRQQRDLSGNSSHDSSESSVDTGDKFGSNDDMEGGDRDGGLSAEGDSQLIWRRSLPNYHRETLAVLNQISQGLLRYLMSGEELALGVIKDFEKQGKEIVNQLGESHKKEYDDFLIRVNVEKEKLQSMHAVTMESVGDDLVGLQEERLVLANLGANIHDDYSALDDIITKFLEGTRGSIVV